MRARPPAQPVDARVQSAAHVSLHDSLICKTVSLSWVHRFVLEATPHVELVGECIEVHLKTLDVHKHFVTCGDVHRVDAPVVVAFPFDRSDGVISKMLRASVDCDAWRSSRRLLSRKIPIAAPNPRARAPTEMAAHSIGMPPRPCRGPSRCTSWPRRKNTAAAPKPTPISANHPTRLNAAARSTTNAFSMGPQSRPRRHHGTLRHCSVTAFAIDTGVACVARLKSRVGRHVRTIAAWDAHQRLFVVDEVLAAP